LKAELPTSTPFVKYLERKQASQGNRKQQDWQTDSPTADREKAFKKLLEAETVTKAEG
jgi:hypothetical protein